MKGRQLFLVLGTIVLVIGVVVSTVVHAQVKTLKIGGTMPLNAGLGIEAKKCWELVVDDINKTGGLIVQGQRYNLELIIYDDKYTADGGKAGVERLIYQDKCRYIIGMIGSAPTYAAVAVTEPEKALLMSWCTTDKIVRPQFKYTIRMGRVPSSVAGNWGYVAKKYPQLSTYAIIAPDDESARGSGKEQKQAAAAYGKKLKDEMYYPRGTTDFSAVATRAKSSNPDMVFFISTDGETELGLQLKALYEAGYRGLRYPLLFHKDVVKKVATNEQMEGVVAPFLPSDLPSEKRNKNSMLVEKLYREKYRTFSPFGVICLKPLYGFLAALKKADSLDIDKIMAAFAGLEFIDAGGDNMLVKRPDLGVDRYIDTVQSDNIGVVRNGELVYDESLSAHEILEACQKIFGGNWR